VIPSGVHAKLRLLIRNFRGTCGTVEHRLQSSMANDRFAFAEFSFEPDTGILTRRHRDLRLPEQTARLLGVLLQRANSVVTREELRQALWPNEEFLDYDQGINVAVNRLRNALRDDPRKPRFLTTIPKRGYRFSGDVKLLPPRQARDLRSVAALELTPEVEEEYLPEPDSPEEELPEDELPEVAPLPAPPPSLVVPGLSKPGAPLPATPPRRASFGWILAAIFVIAVMLAATAWVFHARQPKPVPTILRLALGPLQAQGGPGVKEIAEGVRLQLSDDFSRLPGVQVPAANAFDSSSAVDISHLARELQLDDLMMGTIVQQGDEYDLKFELIRAPDATHLASFEYSGPKKDLPALCDRLQEDVFHYLQSRATTVQSINGSTNDAQAFELYLQGSYLMYERRPDSLRQAEEEFKHATQRDPNFAGAYAGEATACLKLAAYDTDPQHGLLAQAEELAKHAIRLDPLLAQAHAALGVTAYKQDRDFARGEAELRQAIQIDPAQATYRDWLSVLLVVEGRFDEALQQLQIAQTNAPFWPSVYAMEGLVGVYARRDATAIGAAKKYVDFLPSLPIAHNTLAWVYFETGYYEDAIKEWRAMAVLQNDPVRVNFENEGMKTFKSKGIRAYAQMHLDAIRTKRGIGQVNDFMPLEWDICAGKRDEAMAELQRVAASGDPYALHIGVDPLFDSFHQDPRYLAVLAKFGLSVPPALRNADAHLCE